MATDNVNDATTPAWYVATPEEVAEYNRWVLKGRLERRQAIERSMRKAKVTTLRELFRVPGEVRDWEWDGELEEVLRMALYGLQRILDGAGDPEADFGSRMWRTQDGTVLVDDLVRFAWMYGYRPREGTSGQRADR